MKINNPHDRLFKQVLGDTENTKDFLINYLPAEILSQIDVDCLSIQKDSFIGKNLKEHFSDLLFKTRIKNREAYLYFLFEHKSYLHKTVAFQPLKNIVAFWDTKVNKEHAQELPIVVPLFVYHGKDEWNIGNNLSAIIPDYEKMPEIIQRLVPGFEYLVFDFSLFSNEEIRGNIELKILLEILRAVMNDEPCQFLDTISRATIALNSLNRGTRGIDYLEALFRYAMSTREDIDFKDIYGVLKNTAPEGSKIIMTIAEKLFNEGMESRNLEIARQMLNDGVELEKISKYTDLSVEDLEKLRH